MKNPSVIFQSPLAYKEKAYFQSRFRTKDVAGAGSGWEAGAGDHLWRGAYLLYGIDMVYYFTVSDEFAVDVKDWVAD